MTMAERNRQRRALAKANGICQSCNADKAEEGRSKCAGCREVARLSRIPKCGKPGRAPRFSPQDIALMLAKRAEGYNAAVIAKKHGCAASTINRLLRGEIGINLAA